MIQEFHRHRAAQDAEIERRKQELEKQRQENLKKAAENWAREDRLRSEREDLQHNFALVKRDKAALAQRNQDLEVREDLRRRNRYVNLIHRLSISFSFPRIAKDCLCGFYRRQFCNTQSAICD